MALAPPAQAKKLTVAGTSVTVNNAWTPSAGSLVVCHFHTYMGTQANHAASGSTSGSLTKVAAASFNAAISCCLSVHYKANVAGGLENLTANGGASTTALVAIWHEVTGADTTAPYTTGEGSTLDNTSNSNPPTNPVTNSVADSIFFASLADTQGDSATLTVNATGSTPTGWALKSSSDSQHTSGSLQTASVAYLIVTSGAATHHHWTTVSANSGTTLVCFKAAAGAAPASLAARKALLGVGV